MQIFQHSDVRFVGACLNEDFRKARMSLNFYKEYLFGFSLCNYGYMHKQLVTLQRQMKTSNRIIWPL